jgi:hypothetical protein
VYCGPAPTEFERADAMADFAGPWEIDHPDAANSGAPSVLVAYGEANAKALACSGLAGKMLHNCD